MLLATGCAGVVLVASDESWGSWVDIITVFLGGLGARVVIGEGGGDDERTGDATLNELN